MKIATEIGHGCRVEGPHGPTKCGDVYHGSAQDPHPPEPEPAECACGCSAFEDYCATYLAWYAEKYASPGLIGHDPVANNKKKNA